MDKVVVVIGDQGAKLATLDLKRESVEEVAKTTIEKVVNPWCHVRSHDCGPVSDDVLSAIECMVAGIVRFVIR